MKPVYAVATNVLTPLGINVGQVWHSIENGQRGVSRHDDQTLSHAPFWASRFDHLLASTGTTTRERTYSVFEQLCARSIREALHSMASSELVVDASASESLSASGLARGKIILILGTTKGNIEWLDDAERQQYLSLSGSATLLANQLAPGIASAVVSHACVSGVTALQYGARMLESGRFETAIIVGGDRLSRFVLSGFQSFQAIADEPCRPFDAARKGINLGEAAATIILSTKPGDQPLARLCGGATSNDANHISGPSRTGAELARAISNTLKEAGVKPSAVDAISAHGTATIYNDEMEAKAFAKAGLIHAPLHSLKGYLGHTLGAAGVLEIAMLIESLRRQTLIPSIGFEESGVSEPVNVTRIMTPAKLRYGLKTASGFGGCNAAILWEKC